MSNDVRQDSVRAPRPRRIRGTNNRHTSMTTDTPVRSSTGQVNKANRTEHVAQHRQVRPVVEQKRNTEAKQSNATSIFPMIQELFRNDAIDFSVTKRDYYAEAFILEGSITMCPILTQLKSHIEKLTLIEKHIEEALLLYEEVKEVKPVLQPQSTGQQSNTRRRVRVR